MSQPDQLYIGLMSGTSMDAIDTAMVSFAGDKPELIAYEQFAIAEDLKTAVRTIDLSSSLADVTLLDARMGHLFADSVLKILQKTDLSADRVTAIGNHGQTVLHLPDDKDYPRTLQIGDPNIIAHKTGITTVSDFRRKDIANGGQGAPLAPAFHSKVFRSPNKNRVILNIGGVANITVLPSDMDKDIFGFDTGPGNGLLDDWNQLHRKTEMDRDSEWAATGRVNQELLSIMLSDPYFDLPPPKSSGRDHFNLKWLNKKLWEIKEPLKPEDTQASLLQLTLTAISDAIKIHAPDAEEVYMCGGGAHNKAMGKALDKLLPSMHLSDTNELDLDPDAIEAVTFAWLAKQTMDGKTGNEPSVTGAAYGQILGGIYRAS